MNWWIIAYLVLYVGLLFFSLWDDINAKEPLWYVVMDVLCDVAAIALIVAFWLIPRPEIYGLLWLVLFIFSLGWLILTAPHEFKKNEIEIELADKTGRIGVFIGLALLTLFSAPAYIWGGLLSWNYLQGVS